MKALKIIGFVLVVYMGISIVTHRYSHPHLTETQLLLQLPDALAWRR